MSVSRRNFVKSAAASVIAMPLVGLTNYDAGKVLSYNSQQTKICAFTKLFQFLDFDQLAEVFAAAGLDGYDLTVRSGGHVEPENVKKDLPKVVKAAKKHGIEVVMLTTEVTDPDNKLQTDVLKVAADLGIKYYRFGYLFYDNSMSVFDNMDNARRLLDRFADLNQKLGIHGAYQNHHMSPRIGSPVWDLWYILKDLNPDWVSCQFDIWHAVIEGYSSWWHGLTLLGPYIKTRCIKDFTWRVAKTGKLRPEPVPIGEGQINFDAYFQLLNNLGVRGETSLHIEYPVLTTEEATLPIKKKMEIALRILKKDADMLKSIMKKNNFN